MDKRCDLQELESPPPAESSDDSDKEASDKKKKKEPIVQLWTLFRYSSTADKFMILISFIFSAGIGAIQPSSAIVLGRLFTSLQTALLTPATLVENTIDLILIYVYLGTAVTIAAYLAHAFWVLSGENQARRIRLMYVHAILRQDMTWFDKAEDGSLNTRLATDTQMIQEGISEKFGLFVTAISQFLTGFIIAFSQGWRLAVIMLATVPFMIGVGGAMGYFISKYTLETQSSYALAGSVAEQAISGVRTVYSFSLQTRFSDLYNTKLNAAKKGGIKSGIALGLGLGGFMFILFATYALSFWYGGQLVIKGEMNGPDVLVVFLSMMIGAMALLQLPPNLSAVSSACGAAYKIYETIERVPEIDPDSAEGDMPEKIIGDIDFSNVKFTYPTRPDVPILKNLNLKIRAGQTVAFVGPSGSGKSTSIQLLQRFYDPLDGQVLLDGKDLKSYNVAWLRRQIGVVSQEPVLFNMTIRQNLLMGVFRDVPKEEMVEACKKANCHSFISELPEGYNTLVGEHGGMLSGGQKQRVAIARAIIKNPSILLLDEATSALDTQSERLVQKALDAAAADRTTIVIAHRLSTIRGADLIVVMDKGDLIEQGTHNELLALGGVYSELVSKQQIATTQIGHIEEEVDDEELLKQETMEIKKEQANQQELHAILGKNSSNIAIDTLSKVNTNISIDAFELKLKKRKDAKKAIMKKSAPVWRVIKMMRPEWHLIFLGICGSSISGVVFPCFSLIYSRVAVILSFKGDEIAPGAFQGANLYAFLFVIIGIAAFIGFCTYVISLEIAGERFTERLRGQIFAALLRQEIGFYDDPENSLGTLTTKLAIDSKNVNQMITRAWGDIIQIIVTGITGFAIAFSQSWLFALIICCIAPFIVGAAYYESELECGFEDKTKKANEQSGEVAGEAIKEIRTVAALNKQNYFEEKYAKATSHPHKLAQRKALTASVGYALQQGIIFFTNAMGYYAGMRLISEGRITFQQMLTTMLGIMITSEGIGRASVFIRTFAKAKYSAIAAFEILDRIPSIDPELEGIEPSSSQIAGNIKFEDITFRYPARPDISIFNGEFNLNGKAGQTIALVGASGCGKSTTIGMLQRWYDPISGTVRLDDNNVKNYTLGNLRSHMSLVGQEPVLFDMTIGENIRFGVDDSKAITQEMVEDACRAANIHKFITGLSKGYDTRVGDKGSQLSGGQKQRIAIARALIRKPRVLLLDEATSALDSESEKLVQTAIDNILEEGGRTTITIAHRLSTIQGADLICVVKGGRIVEQGTHWELLKLNGAYSSLVYQQSLNAN
ncbi:putative ABC transporter protein [Phycomyces nitens]|nr:putative ABC transporter protein [Phycomyces nitens]